MDGQQRVKEVCQADSLGFGNQPEEGAVAIETLRPALGDDFDGRFAVEVEKFVRRPTTGVFVREIDSNVADPLDVDDGDQLVRQDALDRGSANKFFQSSHTAHLKPAVAAFLPSTAGRD